jgi:tRNA pseudouridine38-40 synthase
MRIALGLEYDGGKFCGWQTQPSGCSVQDHLEAALAKFVAHPVSVTAAGRTDTGVHALAQVVHFDTTAEREAVSWVRGPNAHLDPSIRVQWAKTVPDDFHARFSATARAYDYWLLNDPVDAGVCHGKVGWFHQPLDVEVMLSAARNLLGEHDFTTFRAAECQAKSPVRELRVLDIERHGQFVHFRFEANAFLHHMVRNLVGSLVYVGCGRQTEGWLTDILAARNRALAAPTFAPDGLYLSDIAYDAAWDLPSFRRRSLFPL